jgi:RimJ/RimL family protein N-acetyltransferase
VTVSRHSASVESLRPTSELSPDEISWIRSFVDPHPLFRLYVSSACAALTEGIDNRRFLIGRDRRGLVMGIRFETKSVATVAGTLADDELRSLLDVEDALELHVEAAHATSLGDGAGRRIRKRDVLRYYARTYAAAGWWDRRCRCLGPSDLDAVEAFYRRHYPETIFSSWMLELPFVGVFEDGELLAAAGTVVSDRATATANLGNFLTHPKARGQGLAGIAARALMERLCRAGVATFTLGTTKANAAACRAYEREGFRLLEERIELTLAPTA